MSQQASTPSVATYTDADYAPWLEHDSGRTDRLIRLFTIWWWDHVYRLQAHGIDNLPVDGPYVLVPNHSSYADPFLHARPQQRHLRFMAKASMFTYPIVRTFMKGGGGFPVNRGRGDVFAMELARQLLRHGHPVVVYPEGTRFRESAELGPAKSGAARLALEIRVPIIPAATWGVKDRSIYGRPRWRRPRATTVYGEAMDFSHLEPASENISYVRDTVWERVLELYEQARELDAAR